MSVNNMNVGVDYTLSYYDANQGAVVSLGDVQNVKITAMKGSIASHPYNNVPRFGYVPAGFKIDFTITRTGSTLENLMVAFAQNFNAGNVLKPGFLNQSVNNPDGTVSRYQYTNLVIFMDDHGDIAREKVVTQRVEAMASDKVQIA